MPIVDGKYEAKISTTFATTEEGVEALKKKIQKSRRIRINSIPPSLLEQLKPFLRDKDLKIILPEGQKPDESLRQLGETASTKARIYVDFHGKEANTGGIYFSDTVYNIIWLGDQVLSMSAMEYGKCVKCMMGNFEGGWRYSQKW
jgi:hypothetical protein